MDASAIRAGLQLVLGVGVIVLACLVSEIRSDAGTFATLVGLGMGLIGNVPPGPGGEAELRRLRDEVVRLKSDPPPPPTYPQFPRR